MTTHTIYILFGQLVNRWTDILLLLLEIETHDRLIQQTLFFFIKNDSFPIKRWSTIFTSTLDPPAPSMWSETVFNEGII